MAATVIPQKGSARRIVGSMAAFAVGCARCHRIGVIPLQGAQRGSCDSICRTDGAAHDIAGAASRPKTMVRIGGVCAFVSIIGGFRSLGTRSARAAHLLRYD